MRRGKRAKPDAEQEPTPRRKRRVWRWLAGTLLVVIGLLIAARLALPSYLQSYVNRVLDRSPEYDGRIGTIEVSLWRGAYTIHDLDIVRTTHSVPVPFFESPRVDFSLDWKALFNGAARGKMVMQKPRLNFVHGPSIDETQTGVDQPWLSMIDDLYPFRIDRAEINDGQIHFHAFHTQPRVDVYLSDVEGTVTNLTNIEDSLDPLIARVQARGTAMESGVFEFDMQFDPQSHRPTFNLATRLLDLDVTRVNALARAYGDFDFEGGRLDFIMEAAVKDGFLDGYAKPLFRDLKVLSLRNDLRDEDDPLQLFWEALVGLVGELFKNQPRDQFGTRLTLQGEFDDPRTDLLEIVGNVLHNAFVRAYLPRIEGRLAPAVASPEDAE
jgi:hypothetical protein